MIGWTENQVPGDGYTWRKKTENDVQCIKYKLIKLTRYDSILPATKTKREKKKRNFFLPCFYIRL